MSVLAGLFQINPGIANKPKFDFRGTLSW